MFLTLIKIAAACWAIANIIGFAIAMLLILGMIAMVARHVLKSRKVRK
jgi:hypothetical protein